ncbi:hypothetical protein GCM10009001_16890 [Virgibacillus siamensis]|uniref:Uncharacterized protein n=1 Tax=Virgibacillus siamensis TaxID=480071 RepID=A0ABP3R0A1_9BACI
MGAAFSVFVQQMKQTDAAGKKEHQPAKMDIGIRKSNATGI